MTKPRPLNTKITKLFNIDYPIISAPMFLVSNEQMVVATSEAGGIGTFPALNYRPIENLKKAIKNIKSKTDKPFGMNIIVQKANKHQYEHLDLAIENEVPFIITSLGSPKEIIAKTRGTKTKVFCDIVGLTHAQKVADLGADGLIAVGAGAGGHAGDISLFALLPYIKKHIDLPLIAAGSIVDGKGLLAALALGADAVYMGTRMIATTEAQVPAEYKKSIVEAGSEDIVNTDRVDGFPGNFIKTKLIADLIKPNVVENVINSVPKVKRAVSLLRAGRALLGDKVEKANYKNTYSAGHGVGGIDSIISIEKVIENTMTEYYELLGKMPK